MSLLGLDSDNDTVFMNETMQGWCAARNIAFTRSRPYRKNDQTWVEQKNGAIVRKMVGYRRYEGSDAAAILSELYAASRLYVNMFQPSFKLIEKTRVGAKVTKRHDGPATPCQRLMADARVTKETKSMLAALQAKLDQIALPAKMRTCQQQLIDIKESDHTVVGADVDTNLEEFLAGLKERLAGRKLSLFGQAIADIQDTGRSIRGFDLRAREFV